jgi:drug/metabolite transporter (DMT)-like permease
MVFLTALVDLISGMCLTFGLLLTGGAIFVILYNSCPAWTAILSRFLLGKKLTVLQVGGVILVCIGLVTNVFGSQLQMTSSNGKDTQGKNALVGVATEEEKNASYLIIVGSFIVLFGSLLHSLMFVLSDMSLNSLHQYDEVSASSCIGGMAPVHLDDDDKNKKDSHASSVTGEVWSCCLGSLETVFMTIWVTMGISMYGFNSNSDAKAAANEERVPWQKAAFGFCALVVIDAVHSGAFFTLLKNIGAVASALLKGVQMIVVVALSAVLYCPTERSQCLTWIKAISAVIVLSGVMGYGLGNTKSEALSSSSTAGGSWHTNRTRLHDCGDSSVDMARAAKSLI